jgi:hypothetical protein
MDPQVGDVYGGDVLVEDDRIAAVGRAIEAGDAEVSDATDCIVNGNPNTSLAAWWYTSELKAPEDTRTRSSS